MKNKSSFNSGRGGRVAGTGPNNSSVIAGSSKVGGYSEAEIVNLSRKKTGEDYNKFQDRLKKDFEKYFRENNLRNEIINLDTFFAIIQSFLEIQRQDQKQQFSNEVSEAANVISGLRESLQLKTADFPAETTAIKNLLGNKRASKAVTALIMALATVELVSKFAIDNPSTPSSTLTKTTNAAILGAAGAMLAGPAGGAVGVIAGGLIGESSAEAQKKKGINQKDFDRFFNACGLGNLAIVQDIISQAKAKGNLEVLLTKLDSKYQYSVLYAAVRLGRYEVVKEILFVVKNNPELLKIILTQTYQGGDTSLCLAASLGRYEAVKEILFAVKDNPKLLKIILTQTDQGGDSPSYIAANLGRHEVVKEILLAVKNNPKLLKTILTKTYQGGYSPLCIAANHGKHKVVKEILLAVKDNPELLKTILTKTDKEGFSPLSTAANHGEHKVVKEILLVVKDNPELLKAIVRQKSLPSSPQIMGNLLISGDELAIKTILEIDPGLMAGKLPNIYVSNIPQTAIYYLEAFLKTDEKLQADKIRYFEVEKKSKWQEVKLDNITLFSDKPNSILIEIENKGQTRRILLANDVHFESENSNLQQAVLVASNKESKASNIIFNLALKYQEGEHAITVNMVRNKSKDGWDVIMHDPNVNSKYRPASWKQINQEAITKVCQDVGIKITSLKEIKAIIPNYSNSLIGGSCDMISSIVAASMILENEHSKRLTEKCDKIGVKCVEVLGQELNPEIDKILTARLQSIKNSLKPEIREEASPSSFVEEAKVEKLKSKSVHTEL